MDLPIKFPTETEVIREEVARFRILSPEKKVGELDEMFELYHFLRVASGRPDLIDRMAEEEERAEREAIFDFARRHA
ncbi:MAG: hypothetical protein EXS16_05685 [Gemmataceae bacterium]|nr:hypothetical protein [Gemmataceae bacterium]